MATSRARGMITIAAAVVLAACARAPAEPVARPAPLPEPPPPEPVPRPVEDCRRWTAADAPPPVTVMSADRTFAAELAAQAEAQLAAAFAPDTDHVTRVLRAEEGLALARRSLARDPYGARAALWAAVIYQALDRRRCVRNVVERLIALEAHPALGAAARAEVAAALAAPSVAALRGGRRYQDVFEPLDRGVLGAVDFDAEVDARERLTPSAGCAWFAAPSAPPPPPPPSGPAYRPVPPPDLPCIAPLPALP